MISTLEYNEAARLIFVIQDKYKLYSDEISRVLPTLYQSPHSQTIINANEVKIIENVENYHESPQNST
jgi:hypothetical protein